MSSPLVAELQALLPLLDDDRALDNRWAGDGSEETVAAEMVALAHVLDRARRALLKRTAVLLATGTTRTGTAVLSEDAGWSYGMCARNRQLATSLYGSAGRSATAAALDAGELRVEHAQVIVDAVRRTPETHRDGVEEALVTAAASVDPMVLGRAARYAVRLAAETAHPGELDDAAHEARGLFVAPLLDGIVDVRGTLTAAAGEALLAALTPLAAPTGPDDDRRAPQRRHDALEELARRALAAGDLPEHGGRRPHASVVVNLTDLYADGRGVAGLGWAGAASLTEARTVSCDASVTRLVLNRPAPDSLAAAIADYLPPALGGAAREVLDVGRATRVIGPALRSALVARDRGCTHPGCTMSAAFCDAHHVVHWSQGGPTSLQNLRLLCRRHHRKRHRDDEHEQAKPAARQGSPAALS